MRRMGNAPQIQPEIVTWVAKRIIKAIRQIQMNSFTQSDKSILFESLVGFEYDFYGIDDTSFSIGLEGKRCAFQVLEDPSDGYRSYLDSVQVCMNKKIFFPTPLGRILIEKIDSYSLSGYRLRDLSNGHIWLAFGTDNRDDYYPIFVFLYRAMSPDAVRDSRGICSCCGEYYKWYDEEISEYL